MKLKPGNMSIRKINFKSINIFLSYLSVQEKQGSKLAKLAGTSAMFIPSAILAKAEMLEKVGVRILTRSGYSVPLLFT